ncbi:hypothetical protein NDU88_006986 [Pleurodeles waltl]|uniref:Uncharacterized protein n=1 Tax=Pleurodeles waltl TaxID=8319 RepID=A0AAV7RRQ0_PLEWA|nr:hypothetical protein NDU88_006986 [Pleurodeles waltl]
MYALEGRAGPRSVPCALGLLCLATVGDPQCLGLKVSFLPGMAWGPELKFLGPDQAPKSRSPCGPIHANVQVSQVWGPFKSYCQCRVRAPSLLCLGTWTPAPPVGASPWRLGPGPGLRCLRHLRVPDFFTGSADTSSSVGPAPRLRCSLPAPPSLEVF